MIEAGSDGIAGQTQRHSDAIDDTENLRKGNMEIAQAGVRGLLLRVLLLRLHRQPVLQVPHLVRERAMLRDQQQGCEQYLHQAAFQHGRVTPAYMTQTN
jgi:hypothetical protein